MGTDPDWERGRGIVASTVNRLITGSAKTEPRVSCRVLLCLPQKMFLTRRVAVFTFVSRFGFGGLLFEIGTYFVAQDSLHLTAR